MNHPLEKKPSNSPPLNAVTHVVVGIVIRDQKILLVKPHFWAGHPFWQFPGGRLEPNESEPQAIVREIREETGLFCTALRCLGQRLHPESKKSISYWICEYQHGEIDIIDTKEIGAAQFVPGHQVFTYLPPFVFEPVKQWILAALKYSSSEPESPSHK